MPAAQSRRSGWSAKETAPKWGQSRPCTRAEAPRQTAVGGGGRRPEGPGLVRDRA